VQDYGRRLVAAHCNVSMQTAAIAARSGDAMEEEQKDGATSRSVVYSLSAVQ
jgi:hypothetical protein